MRDPKKTMSALALEDLEPLDGYEPGDPEGRRALIRNKDRLTARALLRERTWSKDGEVHSAMDPDIPSALKCQQNISELLCHTGAGAMDLETLNRVLEQRGLQVVPKRGPRAA